MRANHDLHYFHCLTNFHRLLQANRFQNCLRIHRLRQSSRKVKMKAKANSKRTLQTRLEFDTFPFSRLDRNRFQQIQPERRKEGGKRERRLVSARMASNHPKRASKSTKRTPQPTNIKSNQIKQNEVRLFSFACLPVLLCFSCLKTAERKGNRGIRSVPQKKKKSRLARSISSLLEGWRKPAFPSSTANARSHFHSK